MKQDYIYTKKISIGPNQTIETILEISGDADFILKNITTLIDTNIVYNIFLKFSDSGTSRDFMNDFISVGNLCPDSPALFNLILPKPQKFSKGTYLKITVKNIHLNATINFQLSFIGYKIYS
jgi:hypothetical protein